MFKIFNSIQAMERKPEYENNSGEIMTERLGIITNEERISNLMKAGRQLVAQRSGYEISDIRLAEEENIPLSHKRYADKLEAEQLLADIRLRKQMKKEQKGKNEVDDPKATLEKASSQIDDKSGKAAESVK